MAASHVVRVTMSKMPREEDRKKLLEFYEIMKRDLKKVCLAYC
jgi:hypothetical protein